MNVTVVLYVFALLSSFAHEAQPVFFNFPCQAGRYTFFTSIPLIKVSNALKTIADGFVHTMSIVVMPLLVSVGMSVKLIHEGAETLRPMTPGSISNA